MKKSRRRLERDGLALAFYFGLAYMLWMLITIATIKVYFYL